MTRLELDDLMREAEFPGQTSYNHRELLETHISWVILGDRFAFKIKKPVSYSFLNFSTIEKRKYYCEKEIMLNLRLTEGIYVDVLPIYRSGNRFQFGGGEGELVDFAVRMNKMEEANRMDRLLAAGRVSELQILQLAKKMADFHYKSLIIDQKNIGDFLIKYTDIAPLEVFAEQELGSYYGSLINESMEKAAGFLSGHEQVWTERLNQGFFRDGHGDLHSRNIFLLPDPQPFDCIEFNDDLRQIDVLDEIAFLCMDLDVLGRKDISETFVKAYNQYFSTIRIGEERKLFLFYKSYRANIRAKINLLRANSARDPIEKIPHLQQAGLYLNWMQAYLNELEH